MMYVEFTASQTMEHFLGCHQNAFHFFGIATALDYQACLKNYTVLFTSAIDAVNNLIAAQHAGG